MKDVCLRLSANSSNRYKIKILISEKHNYLCKLIYSRECEPFYGNRVFGKWCMSCHYFLSFSQVCDTKQIIVSERDGETSLAYSVPLKSFEFKFQRAQQSMKLNVILRLLQVIIIIIP